MDRISRIKISETQYKSYDKEVSTVNANYSSLFPELVVAIIIIFKIPLFITIRIIAVIFSLNCGFIMGLVTNFLSRNNIKDHVAGFHGIVLSDILMALKVRSDQPLYCQPVEFYDQYNVGSWVLQSLVNQFKERQFPFFIVGANTLNKGYCLALSAISDAESNYQIVSEKNIPIQRDRR
jgi:hypothetical protein